MSIRVFELDEPFVNAAGSIQNIVTASPWELPGYRGIAIIKCVAGSSRSHHYHKRDAHMLYVISGHMRYYERPHGSEEPPESAEVLEGRAIFTEPMVEHSTYFPVDTVLLSLSMFGRDHDQHESDVVRVEPLGGP